MIIVTGRTQSYIIVDFSLRPLKCCGWYRSHVATEHMVLFDPSVANNLLKVFLVAAQYLASI